MYILLFLLLLSFFFLISFQIMYYLLHIEMVDEIRSQKTLSGNYGVRHGLRTPGEEIAFTARPKIKSQSQCYRYGRSIFQLSHRPKVSDFFDLLMPSLGDHSPWLWALYRKCQSGSQLLKKWSSSSIFVNFAVLFQLYYPFDFLVSLCTFFF